ncbi:MAG: aldolase/citrate lyase family protein [Gemmatimonadota bacterium]|nr:aldolase/citrate lyase family protein [Gemmatimonadota bacterium]
MIRIGRHAAFIALTAALCTTAAEAQMTEPSPSLAELLADGQVIFGIFPGEQSAAGGAEMAKLSGMDFVFYSLENGPFDLETYAAYVDAMQAGLGADAPRRPMALRIPPVGDDPQGAIERAGQALEAGIDVLVVPHVQTAAHAAASVRASGPDAWPARADGAHLNFLIVEDREGIANVSEIVATDGVSVVFAGPGDLSRAYERDMEAVENAIQTVLAACREHDVPCGITAGVDDIGERIAQGFRVFIVTDPAAIAVGREAAGR